MSVELNVAFAAAAYIDELVNKSNAGQSGTLVTPFSIHLHYKRFTA